MGHGGEAQDLHHRRGRGEDPRAEAGRLVSRRRLAAAQVRHRRLAGTLLLVNAIGFLCEAAYHHADLAVTWAKVWVKLMTHSAGGITDKDFALARKIVPSL